MPTIFSNEVRTKNQSIVDRVSASGRALGFSDFDIFGGGIFGRGRNLVRFQKLHAEIADLAQAQIRETRVGFGHLTEDILDSVKTIAVAERVIEIAKDFPIVTRMAGTAHGP